jgi:ABC-2 type transport system permease protein
MTPRGARAIGATMRNAAAESRANPGAFWTQLAAMVLNDVAWIVFWLLFFDRVDSLHGWDRSRVLLLLAVLTTAGGLVLGVFSNARAIGRLVADGGIDAALALPVPPLPYLLVRRIDAVNIGDLVFGIGLFVVAGQPTLERSAIYVFGSLAAAVVLGGFLVTAGSLSFFMGRSEAGELGFHAVILLSSYPIDIFAGSMKVLLYTAVPAAFISGVPSRLVDDFSVAGFFALAGAAAITATVAGTVFHLGLRRYRSSAAWVRA